MDRGTLNGILIVVLTVVGIYGAFKYAESHPRTTPMHIISDNLRPPV